LDFGFLKERAQMQSGDERRTPKEKIMLWKLGLVFGGFIVVVSCGFFLAGQFAFQQELTNLPEADEPQAPISSNQEPPQIPAKTENTAPVKEDKIILATAKDVETNPLPPITSVEPKVESADAKLNDTIPPLALQKPPTSEPISEPKPAKGDQIPQRDPLPQFPPIASLLLFNPRLPS
jgi:cytoskeletal protein RodZ